MFTEEETLDLSVERLVWFSRSVMPHSLRPHGLQRARLPFHHQLLESERSLLINEKIMRVGGHGRWGEQEEHRSKTVGLPF